MDGSGVRGAGVATCPAARPRTRGDAPAPGDGEITSMTRVVRPLPVRRPRVAKSPDAMAGVRKAFAEGLASLDDGDLSDQGRRMAWLSNFASTQPASRFHWQYEACRREARSRGKSGLVPSEAPAPAT